MTGKVSCWISKVPESLAICGSHILLSSFFIILWPHYYHHVYLLYHLSPYCSHSTETPFHCLTMIYIYILLNVPILPQMFALEVSFWGMLIYLPFIDMILIITRFVSIYRWIKTFVLKVTFWDLLIFPHSTLSCVHISDIPYWKVDFIPSSLQSWLLCGKWSLVMNSIHSDPFQYKTCSIPILDFLAPICRSNGRCWIRGGTCPPRPKEDFYVEIPSDQNHGILGITLCILGGSNMDHSHYRHMVIAVP